VSLKIVGVVADSLVDWPGRTVITVFLSGCNFRCGWCFNPDVVEGNLPEISEKTLSKLRHIIVNNPNWYDGIVITGGEPTINVSLPSLCKKLKDLFGLPIKLDTNGTNSYMLKLLVDQELVDYVAMDIKAPPHKYDEAVGLPLNVYELTPIHESIKYLIKQNKIPYEFRTTLVPGIHNIYDIEEICFWIHGAKQYYLQNFVPYKKCVHKSFETRPSFTRESIESFINIAKKYISKVGVRNIITQ